MKNMIGICLALHKHFSFITGEVSVSLSVQFVMIDVYSEN